MRIVHRNEVMARYGRVYATGRVSHQQALPQQTRDLRVDRLIYVGQAPVRARSFWSSPWAHAIAAGVLIAIIVVAVVATGHSVEPFRPS
jgi:hypothetical protein